MSIQKQDELEDFYNEDDPWGYENNPSDKNRKSMLVSQLAELPKPKRVLDIGCGHGFITRDIVGDKVIGVDISEKAIEYANKASKTAGKHYIAMDMFDLTRKKLEEDNGFDLIIITGVLYPQYIENARVSIYQIIDDLLVDGGIVVSVHINDWYTSRFPYPMLKTVSYEYREYQHTLEVYIKK